LTESENLKKYKSTCSVDCSVSHIRRVNSTFLKIKLLVINKVKTQTFQEFKQYEINQKIALKEING
jgi:hypothetical protein